MWYRLLGKNGAVTGSVFRQKFVCCALIVLYSTHNTVGRTIASIYNLDSIFTSGFHDSVNVSPQNIYCISAINLPTYYVLRITYVCVFVCHQLCPVGAWKNSLQAKGFPVSTIGQSKQIMHLFRSQIEHKELSMPPGHPWELTSQRKHWWSPLNLALYSWFGFTLRLHTTRCNPITTVLEWDEVSCENQLHVKTDYSVQETTGLIDMPQVSEAV